VRKLHARICEGEAKWLSYSTTSDAEIAPLLDGPSDPELADAIRIAALSGMRIEEIYRLTVANCRDGWFDVKTSKTRAGIRRVPIHSALVEIVASQPTPSCSLSPVRRRSRCGCPGWRVETQGSLWRPLRGPGGRVGAGRAHNDSRRL
jgi:integrase